MKGGGWESGHGNLATAPADQLDWVRLLFAEAFEERPINGDQFWSGYVQSGNVIPDNPSGFSAFATRNGIEMVLDGICAEFRFHARLSS